MKATKGKNPKKKGGDSVKQTVSVEEVRLGRPPKTDRDEIILKNGFSKRQWQWFRQEAKQKGMDTMTYIRKYPAQWWIDSIESSRADSVATPEDDEAFEKIMKISSVKTNHRNKE